MLDEESLSPPLRELLDGARFEAKRLGHGTVEPVHLAAAFPKIAPDIATVEFGAELASSVSSKLDQLEPTFTAPTVGTALQQAFERAREEDSPDTYLAGWVRGEVAVGVTSTSISTTDGDDQDASELVVQDPVEAPASGPAIEPWIADSVEIVSAEGLVLGRDSIIERVLIDVRRRSPVTACLVGRPGSGRTTILSSLVAALDAISERTGEAGPDLVRLRPEVVARNSGLIERIAASLPDAILVCDDLGLIAGLDTQAPDLKVLAALRVLATRRRPLVLIGTPQDFSALEMLEPDLHGSFDRIDVPVLDEAILEQVVASQAAAIATHHRVTLDGSTTIAALRPAPIDAGRVHPGLALDRLDQACARAAILGLDRVTPADLEATSRVTTAVPNTSALADRLQAEVLGQASAVDTMTARLMLTRAQLDLRPERPDGVFLFVGPTGVGKSQLAKALSRELFGSPDALIRLDMSEYAHDWAISRLIGPQPGYVGYTEPDAWLTTKVRERPDSVILLDEIEKAHPTVWNTFLQVFDDGRLTDARGNVASFSDAVIIMTSNLGSDAFTHQTLGFTGAAGGPKADAKVRAAVEEAMPAELINRFDAVVVFEPLDPEMIRHIARKEISETTRRLALRDYAITIDDAVIDAVAATDYDERYGARHLQRNVERLVLEPLARRPAGAYRCELDGDGHVVWLEQTE